LSPLRCTSYSTRLTQSATGGTFSHRRPMDAVSNFLTKLQRPYQPIRKLVSKHSWVRNQKDDAKRRSTQCPTDARVASAYDNSSHLQMGGWLEGLRTFAGPSCPCLSSTTLPLRVAAVPRAARRCVGCDRGIHGYRTLFRVSAPPRGATA